MSGCKHLDMGYLSPETYKRLIDGMKRTSEAWKKRKAKLLLKEQGHGLEAGAAPSDLHRDPNCVSRPVLDLGIREEITFRVSFSTDLNSMKTLWLCEAAYKRFLRDCTESNINVHKIEKRTRNYRCTLSSNNQLVKDLVLEFVQ